MLTRTQTVVGILVLAAGTALVAPRSVDAVPDWEIFPYVPVFLRGDVNGDELVQLNDAVAILSYLYAGGHTPECLKTADVSDDGGVDLGDAVLLLDYLFSHGMAPTAPFPAPGTDPTPDDLECTNAPQIPMGEIYTLFDNGIVCIQAPCPHWTAVTEEGNEVSVTDVSLVALNLDPDQEQQLLSDLSSGEWTVRGAIEHAEDGVTTTLYLLEVLDGGEVPESND